ncbi:MAG: 30S ribosomal protein S30 [Alphaproteobacteria bacterium]|nr:30S ribosomal protein S30 [Alphaproteobacteria bacterium]
MEIPLEIAFEGLEPSDSVAARVRQEASKLEHFYHRITSCRVVIDKPHQHHQRGNAYYVRIHVTLPGGGDVVVSRDPGNRRAHSDVYAAIHDAFAAAKRQLQSAMRRRQSRVRHHEELPPGIIAKIYPYEGYGIIAAPGGRDVYFDRESVADEGFDALEPGQEVMFSEVQGEHGAQAVAVRGIAKRKVH